MAENRLKELRKSHKLTQKQLGEILKLDQTTVSKIESGVQEMSAATLREASGYFNVTIDYLLCKEGFLEGKISQGIDNIEKNSPVTNELLELFKLLSEDDQQAILGLAKHMAGKKE